jgi:hypothetical protein
MPAVFFWFSSWNVIAIVLTANNRGKFCNGSILLQETVDFRKKLPEIVLFKSTNPVKF